MMLCKRKARLLVYTSAAPCSRGIRTLAGMTAGVAVDEGQRAWDELPTSGHPLPQPSAHLFIHVITN